jgi:hypothetical protein
MPPRPRATYSVPRVPSTPTRSSRSTRSYTRHLEPQEVIDIDVSDEEEVPKRRKGRRSGRQLPPSPADITATPLSGAPGTVSFRSPSRTPRAAHTPHRTPHRTHRTHRTPHRTPVVAHSDPLNPSNPSNPSKSRTSTKAIDILHFFTRGDAKNPDSKTICHVCK